MTKFTTEAKVGVFVLLGLALLAYMSFRVGGFDFRRDKGYQIHAVFETASGLKPGVPVETAGIEIGTVEAIGLEEGQARVTMRIASRVPLHVDSQAMIRTKGVLGDKYVEIVPGTKEAPVLEPGQRIVQTSAPADVDQLINKISEISVDIKKVTHSLSEVLGGEEGTAHMRRILSNLRETSDTLAQLVRDNNEYLNQTIQNLTAFSEDLRDISRANKDDIAAILVSFRRTSETMSQTIAAVQEIAEKINRGEGSVGALVNDQTTVKNLNETLASLREISDKINQGQGTIGKLINETTTADKLDQALSGVNDYLTKTDAFKFYIDYRGEWMMAYDDLRATLNVRIQPKQDKYYLVGISTDTYGTYKKSERTYTVGGRPVTSIEESWDRGDIRFNAQIAKRYYDFVVRGGLIESSGGFGLDYYMLDDAFKVTFEASQGEVDHNAHLRFGVSYDFWKFFYVTVGYDDIISDVGRDSGFFGIGLRFYDEDLKYLLTSAPVPTGN